MDIDLFFFLYISKRNVYYKTQNATKWKLFFLFSWKNSYDACQLSIRILCVSGHSCSMCILDFKYFL